MKRTNIFGLLIATLLLSGCSALTLQQAAESVNAKRDTSEKKENKVIETGSPPLVSKTTTISVESEGPVSIHAPKTEENGNVLTAEILKALSAIKNHRNTDQTTTSKESVEVSFYKKSTYLGGMFFILVAVACLLVVRAMKQLRLESTKWGFDPKTVGQSAHKMFKMLEGVGDSVSREHSSLVNKLTDNGISDDTAGQINRQLLKLSELKKLVDKVDMIPRTHSGA